MRLLVYIDETVELSNIRPLEGVEVLNRLGIDVSGIDEEIIKNFNVGEFKNLISQYCHTREFEPCIKFSDFMLKSKLKSTAK